MGDDNTFDKHTAFGIVQSLEFGGTFAVFDECMDDVVFLCVAEELLVRVATCELASYQTCCKRRSTPISLFCSFNHVHHQHQDQNRNISDGR